MRHRFSFLCIIFLLCLFSNSASAQLDPEVNKPYPLNVVLHFSKHRILTPVFQNQVQQHLADLLRTNFGKLAEVKVVRTNPLITKIKENGLQSVLDGFDRLTKIKTQYVLIDFQDGEYQIRTRQHDGWTGLASPMVRRAATKDRSQIVRRIADLIDREFGISGTVTQVNGPTVKVNLRGGSLKNSLDQWIEPGDVFAVCRIHRQGPKYHSQQLEWAYLIVNAVFPQGYCHCRFVYRYEEDQLNDLPGVVGYRCLLLPTGQGPLSLQLIGAENSSVDGLQVHAGQEGFNQPVAQVALNSDGIVRSSKIFDKIAYVRVLSGSRPVAQFAVPIIPGRTYTSRIHVNPDVLSQSQIQLRYDRWLRRMYDDLSIAGDRVALLNQKLAESPEAALGHAKRGLKNLSGELRNLALEKMQLQTAAREKKIDLEFSEGKQRLQELKDLRTKLAGFIGRLEKMIKEAKSEETKKIKTLITQAGL